MLRILGGLPSGLVDLPASRLADALGGPALIRIPGELAPPVLVSVLLHGNETTGWEAVRLLLGAHRGRPLPRALDLFIGNVHAARHQLRRLDGQPDYNRIWKGADGPEGQMARRLMAQARTRRPLAALDVHNTSGRNPLYACYHRDAPEHLALARSFSDTVVFVERPDTLLAVALAAVAPAITMECGRPGDPDVERQVAAFLEAVLVCESVAPPPTLFEAPPVLRTVATVRVPDTVTFSVGDTDADLRLLPDLDVHNFRMMPVGTPVAMLRPGGAARLEVLDDRGSDVWDRYFQRDNDHLVTATPMMPSLLTMNERIIRQDCLCYVMEPLTVPGSCASAD